MSLNKEYNISRGLPRTVEGAREAIRRYTFNNPELEPRLCRLMALSACGKYFGRKVLEEAVGQVLPQMPFRDWSWRWWNALNLAGLGKQWPGFVKQVSGCGMSKAAQWLRRYCTDGQYKRFMRLAGVNPDNSHRPLKDVVWTKGGVWRVESGMTKLLVLHERLPQRPLKTKWQKRLGHQGVRLLEKELMRAINPDAMLSFEAKERAIDYLCRRIPQLLRWPTKKTVSVAAAAWFFQQPVPERRGAIAPNKRTGYVIVKRDRKIAKYHSW